MEELPLGYFFLAIPFALAALAFQGAAAFKKVRVEAWRRFAKEHRLAFDEGPQGGSPQLSGTWDGVPVTLRVEYVQRGNRRSPTTRATARLQTALPRGLSVSAEGMPARLVKLLGAQDVQVGIPEVDQKFRIKAEDEAGTRALFQNWRFRQAAVTFAACGRGATLSQHQATVARDGFLFQPGDLAGLLVLVARCAREVAAALAAPALAAPAQPVLPPPPAAPTPPPSAQPPRPAPATIALDRPRSSAVPPSCPAPAPPATPARSPALARPPAAVPAPAALDPVTAVDRLLRLGDRALGSTEREALVGELRGHAFSLRLDVERVAPSQGFDLPTALDGGHTVIGKPAGQPSPRLVARFPAHADARVCALSWGDHVAITARLAGWDEFYRQALLDADLDASAWTGPPAPRPFPFPETLP